MDESSVDDPADALPVLWELITFTCFDGASAMRSTPLYAGLDANPAGSSFLAYLKRNGKPNLPNLHCICHNVNLALKEAMQETSQWLDVWSLL